MSRANLAINGGPKVREDPLPPRQLFGPEEKDALISIFEDAIESGRPLEYNGPRESEYCDKFADYMGGGYADGVNSGTSAVFVALRALDIEPFSEVIVSPITDSGGQMPVAMLGCIPVVADSAPGSYNTGPEQIEDCITSETSAICISHIGGEPLEMEGIADVARDHDLPVIEDVSQAHGARLNGQLVGTFGDIAAFSTMSGKHHSTGAQGGVVYTRNEDLYWRARQAADRGKPFGPDSKNVGYLDENGFASLNFNMDDLSAAIGCVQLDKLPTIVERRREVVSQLQERLQEIPSIDVPELVPGSQPSYWFWRLRLNESELRCDKSSFCEAVRAEGISITPRYDARPHEDKWYQEQRVFGESGYPWASPAYQGDSEPTPHLPNAESVLDHCFNLNINERWSDREIADTVEAFRKVTDAYS